MTGRIVHFEIPFDDGNRAREFYRQAFDWNIQEMPEMQYTIAMTGPVAESGMPQEPGFINGGMFQRSENAPSGPVITIEVSSIDDALAKIGSLGGSTVQGKEAVGDMGFAAYFTDPEGNVIGLWETAGGGQ